jgi:3-phosphoshikimate 1-carboxyvinyltransferase
MIRVPGDKSISHRALFLAALAHGESRLSGLLPGEDCRSTARCLRALGVAVPELPDDGSGILVRSRGAGSFTAPAAPLDCGNSGTTARLLLGLLAGLPISAVITGDDSLRSRPMRRVTGPIASMGASFREEGEEDRLPVRVTGGTLRALEYRSPVASAQVKTALLLAGLTGRVPVTVHEPVRSRDHTERMLRLLGVEVEEGPEPPAAEDGSAPGWRVAMHPPGGPLPPLQLQVPGDFSSAAFLLALGVLGGAGEGLRIGHVGVNPTRTGLLQVLERMGGRVRVERRSGGEGGVGEPVGDLEALPSLLQGTEVRPEEVPALVDEIPVLAALAARARGVTRIRGAEELRVKESDRIRAVALNLRALGVRVEEFEDGLSIEGTERPLIGRVRTFQDHRIAMTFGVLGALPGNRIEVEDPETVEVSFPGFWDRIGALRRRRRPVITIDGPAGSGKSTTARAVAGRLGYRHLDSGALYRGLTLALLRSGVDPADWERLSLPELQALAVALEPDDGGFRVLLDVEDPGEALRSPEVTGRVSHAARIPAVRERLLGLQREAGRGGGIVADGRDMGTVVFPEAEVKVFLLAELEERARRRMRQEGREWSPEALRAEADRLRERDRLDQERTHSPLRRPEAARVLDTTTLAFEEQVDRIVAMVRKHLADRERGEGSESQEEGPDHGAEASPLLDRDRPDPVA